MHPIKTIEFKVSVVASGLPLPPKFPVVDNNQLISSNKIGTYLVISKDKTKQQNHDILKIICPVCLFWQ